jgi:hypothetical protein
LWVRGSRRVGSIVGASIESISIASTSRFRSCSTRFRRAVDGASGSVEDITVGTDPGEGYSDAISSSTVRLNVRGYSEARNVIKNCLRSEEQT